jgi:RES domain-containing protein
LKIYRIARTQYISDLSGEGARLYGGRWNAVGHNMLYFSSALSLSVLELLVHLDYQFINSNFSYIELELPDNLILPKVPQSILKQDWRQSPPTVLTQNFGTKWITSNKSVALSVPSAVLPTEHNILLNPNHADFKLIKTIKKTILNIDSRVFKS